MRISIIFHFPLLLFLVLTALPLRGEEVSEIRKLLVAAGGKERHGDAHQVVVYDRTVNRAEENGRTTKVISVLYKILTPEGARNRSVATLGYDPKTKRAAFLRIRVFKGCGSEVVDVPTEPVDIPNPGGIIFWGGRRKILPIPRLEAGDGLEIVTETVGFNIAYLHDDDRYIPPMVGHFYDVIPFWTGLPLLEKSYTLIAPRTKKVRYKVYNGALETSLDHDGDHMVYGFKARDLTPFEGEELMVSKWDVAPKLVLATVPDWPTKSRWFWKVNEPMFKADEAIRKKVYEIIEGKKTDEEKIKALVHWVADEVRYLGLSMGKGEGYTTHPATMTFHERSGVCKDKAGLLVSMLRVAGFESYITMTQVGSRVEAVPADQFNHAVTALRLNDGRFLMLDPTWAPASREMWSSLEQEQNIVIGTPGGEPLGLSPYFPPEANRLSMVSDVKVALEGEKAVLAGELILEGEGYGDTWFRRKLVRTPAGKLTGFFESILEGVAPGTELREVEFVKPLDYSRAMRVVLRWRAPNATIASDEKIFLKSPVLSMLGRMPLVDRFIDAAKPDSRKYPFNLRNTLLIRFRETLELPPGFCLDEHSSSSRVDTVETEAVASEGGERYFSFRLADKGGPGASVVEGDLVVPHKIVPPGAYDEYKRAVSEMREAMCRWTGIRRK